MSDRLYQSATLPLDEAEPHLLANIISDAVLNLAANAEERTLPLALDWSEVRVLVEQRTSVPGRLRVEVSAPVL